MRLPRSVRTDLEQAAARARRSVSDVAQELIDEGLRMRECLGIFLAPEPSGRTAKISGTGLGVWEVLRDFVHDDDLERVRRAFPRLSSAQITGADLLEAVSRRGSSPGECEHGRDRGGAPGALS